MRLSKRPAAPPAARLQDIKLRALERAFDWTQGRTFADLGGVWAVEAGYTFHVLDTYTPERAVLVDTGPTPGVIERAKRYPALEIVRANFGTEAAAEQVGHVDVLAFFDVLLHQVKPDWDAVLALYAQRAEAIVVVQPQWRGSDDTVRLLDLGSDRYHANIPPEQPPLDFATLDDIDPRYDRPVRDIHEIWQWGITARDLVAAAKEHGLRPVHYEDGGTWHGLPRFVTEAFVLVHHDRVGGGVVA